MCDLVFWFILASVFESLWNFFLFFEKNLIPIREFLFCIVADTNLNPRVAVLNSRGSSAGCPSIQSRICLEVGIFKLRFAYFFLSVIPIGELIFFMNVVWLV